MVYTIYIWNLGGPVTCFFRPQTGWVHVGPPPVSVRNLLGEAGASSLQIVHGVGMILGYIWAFPKIGVFPPKWTIYNGNPS